MEQAKNDRVSIGLGSRNDGQCGVLLSIPQGPITGDDGNYLYDGMVLLPEEARQLAYTLLYWADAKPGSESLFMKRWSMTAIDPNKEAAIADFLGTEKGGPLQ